MAACGSSGPSEGALQGKTATAITGMSIEAYHRQQSVSFVTKTVVGTTSTIEIGATSRAGAAAETVTTNGRPVIDAVFVDNVAYLRSTASFLEHSLNLSTSTATAYAGKWISLQEENAAFKGVVSSLSPTQAIRQFVPEEPNLRVAGATSVGGRTAVAVSGKPFGPAPTRQHGDNHAVRLDDRTLLAHQLDGRGQETRRGRRRERLASVYGKIQQACPPDRPKGGRAHLSTGCLRQSTR